MLKNKFNLISLVLLSLLNMGALAEVAPSADELEVLNKQSIAKAEATAHTPPTIDLIMAKIREGAKLVEKEGPDAFSKFRGNSRFIFSGTYIWIHDIDGVMLVHPIKPKMEGNSLINLKDARGKFIFAEMNSAIQTNSTGEAWIEYMWPKPGQDKPSQKVSFVKKVVFKGKIYVLGCGIYDAGISTINEAIMP